MSAIAGILNLDDEPVKPALIKAMVDALAHCGPDGRGIWVEGATGLGHCAHWTTPEAVLESLPRSVGGRLVITGDVRLDNRDDLIRSLPKDNALSASASDCALVVAAYEKWGESCVDHLLGDFAFAIWDRHTHRLFCARDHMGVKPFYYALVAGRRFVFATEIKAVLTVPGVSERINERSVADMFVHLVNDPAATYYAQVARLPAAHCLTFTTAVSLRRYWRLNPERELHLNSDQEYAEGFREHFSRAVHCRLRSNQRIGSMLSGGMDSSSVSCVARDWLKAHGQPKLHTFSGVFDEVTECDERPFIKTVLEQGHCEPTFIVIDRFSPLGEVDLMTWQADKPAWAYNLYFVWHAYRKAREIGVNVVLDGFDGDTTVSHGFGRLQELAEAGKWRDLAIQMCRGSKIVQGEFWPGSWWQWVRKYHPVAQRFNRLLSAARRRLGRSASSNNQPWDAVGLVNPELAHRLDLRAIARNPKPRFKSERAYHGHLLEREIMSDCLEVAAHVSAPFNVNVRYPFMDIRLIEYCLSLPSDQKLRNKYSRFVMHQGMAGILPDKIQQRGGKSNLAPSFTKGLRKFESDNLAAIIRSETEQLAAFINLPRINEFLDRFKRGDSSTSELMAIWKTAILAMWLRNRRGPPNNLHMMDQRSRHDATRVGKYTACSQ